MTTQQHPNLAEFLTGAARPDGTLTYIELQGFLYAVACAPEPVPPRDWAPVVFNNDNAGYLDTRESRTVLDMMKGVYKDIQQRIDAGRFELPVVVDGAAIDNIGNIGNSTPLAQWARGFDIGQDWLHEVWSLYTPPVFSEDLDWCTMVLCYFSSRQVAEHYFTHVPDSDGSTTLAEFSETILDEIETAMRDYANLGRLLNRIVEEFDELRESEPAEQSFEPQGRAVDRDGPCPCGSGKIYRKCCLQ